LQLKSLDASKLPGQVAGRQKFLPHGVRIEYFAESTGFVRFLVGVGEELNMGVRSLIALLSLVSLFGVAGCSKDAQKIEPETRGKRGENCQARNDCQAGLACLNGVCGQNEFPIDVAVKQCDRIECATTDDCCGDTPTTAPAKCNARDATCTPTRANCNATTICTSNAQCGEGTCRAAATLGTCSGGVLSSSCETVADCQDLCAADGFCTISSVACTADTECSYYTYNASTVCTKPSRTCDCANPDYFPSDPICSDRQCDDLCLLRCEDERCVTDRSCEEDVDCAAFGLPICSDGRCVSCEKSADCADGFTCLEGACKKPCEHNEECPLFNECDADSGECKYVGCKSDRECVLSANASSNTPESVPTPTGEDARLQKCLPSESDAKINTCKIPCENDGSCGQQSVCDDGYCKFIGCETDEECRAYLGLTNQVPTEARPFVATAVCRP
jgi:hypothetical protein